MSKSNLLTIVVLVLCLLCMPGQAQTPPNNCPNCFSTLVCGTFKWTPWLNRDAPSGTGDWETVSDAVALGGCAYPAWVECKTTTGLDWWKTGEVIIYSAYQGCICRNADQPDQICNFDYTMRELCRQ